MNRIHYTSLDEDEAAAVIRRHAHLLCGTSDPEATHRFISAINNDDVTLCVGSTEQGDNR